jgi:hypothetical protein
MNPLPSFKCARRLLMALAAISGIFLAAGCGSSNSPAPNPGGFSNSSLTGTYIFSSSGSDSNTGAFLTLAGEFTADGKGGITGGTMDVVDPAVTPASPVAQPITSGSYSVGTDGRGHASLTSSVGTFILDFVLTSSAHGLVSEFDGNGTGSGTIDLQTANVTNLSQIAGPYAFSLAGADFNDNPFASNGAFVLNSSGATTSGIADFNDSTITFPGQAITTGTATLGTGTGPLAITLTTPSFVLTFDFYPISATHWKLIETDDNQFLAGDVFTQTGASIPTGAMVFTMSGGTINLGPIAVGGLMTSDGQGNFAGGLEDVNNSGTLSTAQVPFTGTASIGPFGAGGRVVVNLNGFQPNPTGIWVIYPTTSAGLLMLEMDSTNLTQGAAFAQTATSFSTGTSVGYGLNLAGVNINSAVDDIAQFNATSSATNNMSGILDENDQGITVPRVPLSGAYTPDSPATGRGSITVTTNGTFLGGLNLEYYVVDSSTALTIEGDNSQVTAGTFELQSTPAAAAAHPHLALVHLKPSARGALKQGKK